MKIIECIQGCPAWHEARRGIPTASRFDKIITPKTGKPSASQADLICELIAERLGVLPEQEPYVSRAMEFGLQCEPEARNWYALETDMDVKQVGFITTDDGRFGCSPDGMVGEDGGLELKCPFAKSHIRYLLAGPVVPPEYLAQVHGCLIVTGRSWWDFVSYSPPLPPLVVREVRGAFTLALQAALEVFWESYAAQLAYVQNYGRSEPSDALMGKLRESVELAKK